MPSTPAPEPKTRRERIEGVIRSDSLVAVAMWILVMSIFVGDIKDGNTYTAALSNILLGLAAGMLLAFTVGKLLDRRRKQPPPP